MSKPYITYTIQIDVPADRNYKDIMRETNSKPSKTTKQSDSDEIQETEAAIGYLTDLAEAVETAIVNKRAGGTGLISGRKAFQKEVKVGVELLNAIQDVYLDKDVTIA